MVAWGDSVYQTGTFTYPDLATATSEIGILSDGALVQIDNGGLYHVSNGVLVTTVSGESYDDSSIVERIEAIEDAPPVDNSALILRLEEVESAQLSGFLRIDDQLLSQTVNGDFLEFITETEFSGDVLFTNPGAEVDFAGLVFKSSQPQSTLDGISSLVLNVEEGDARYARVGVSSETYEFQAGLEQTASHSQLDFDTNPNLVLNAGDGDERHKVVRYILNSNQMGVGVVPYPDGDEAGATGADIPVDLISLFGLHRHFFVKVSIYGGQGGNIGSNRFWFRGIYLSARFNADGLLLDHEVSESTSVNGSFNSGTNSVDVNVTEVNDKVNFNISTAGIGGNISTLSVELISKLKF